MKDLLVKILKVTVPLAFGVFLIWLVFNQLKPQDIEEIKNAMAVADYSWILLSMLLALLSHASRAYRWKYTMQPLGHEPRFMNSFFAVMIGYFSNLGIPRSGELLRCGVMSRYEKVPVQKLFGTVIAERVADFLILIAVSSVVVILQFKILEEYVAETFGNSPKVQMLTSPAFLIAAPLIGIAGFWLFMRIVWRSKNPFMQKIKGFIAGLLEGIKSIWTMEQKWGFLLHTAIIWVLYVLMFYVCFFALPDTRAVPFAGILAGFVVGGMAIVLTPGGIGAYPIAIQVILGLYGVNDNMGIAFGWIVWVAQTILLVSAGGLSMILMPQFNKNNGAAAANPS